jgi:DNA (cytosine-5)-methyltransferase 1
MNNSIKLIEAFSGIGAWRKALIRQNIKFKSLGYFEINKFAIDAYCKLYNDSPKNNFGDITKCDFNKLPDFNLFCWSAPCQSWSIAGMRKGIEDDRGKLLFNTLELIKIKKPEYSLMENVSGLLHRENKLAFDKVLLLLKEYGYNNYYKVLDAKDFGIPQSRKRIFLISIRKDIDQFNNIFPKFRFPRKQKLDLFLYDLLENEVDKKYYLSDKAIKGMVLHKERHKSKGNGFGYEIVDKEANTITARVYKTDSQNLIQLGYLSKNSDTLRVYNNMSKSLKSEGGGYGAKTGLYMVDTVMLTEKRTKEAKKIRRENLKKGKDFCPRRMKELAPREDNISNCITSGKSQESFINKNSNIRRLTPRECFRLMGFDDSDFNKLKGVSDTQLYKLAGNSIVVNTIEAIYKNLF